MKKDHKITIEKLAEMSQREFTSLSGRFDKVDERFDKVHEDSAILRRDVEAGFHELSSGTKTIIGQLRACLNDAPPAI